MAVKKKLKVKGLRRGGSHVAEEDGIISGSSSWTAWLVRTICCLRNPNRCLVLAVMAAFLFVALLPSDAIHNVRNFSNVSLCSLHKGTNRMCALL